MEDRKGIQGKGFQGIRRIPLGIVATLATVVLASGGAAAWFTWRTLNPVKPPVAEFPVLSQPESEAPVDPPIESSQTPTVPKPAQEAPTTAPAVQEAAGQIFWVKDVDGRLALSPESVSLPGSTSDEQLEAAFEALFSKPGNPSQDAVTTIPDKTQVLDVSVESDGVHVDLSQTFETGGGSTSMIGRLGQIVYTATALDPDAPVWISVEGKPLTLLGGEGIEVSQPMTRDDVKTAFDL
ncbi:MAG: GerMN domain-containing protein [Cyanobacteria bacterium Co-bin8]|nr:GerMN domain-containing protein [Cyanobacteria bacterium Co-bin8]